MRIAAGELAFLGCAIAAVPAVASGESRPTLTVERLAGADTCPDSAALAARIEAIRGGSSLPSEYDITFARDGETWTATIRSAGDAASERVLRTEGAACDELAQAAAVALSLLIDAATPRAAPPPKAELPPQASAPPAKAPEAPDDAERRLVAGVLAVGGDALIGVVRPIAPTLAAELGTAIGDFRAGVGAVWMIPQHLSLPPGSVYETLGAGSARLCFAPFREGTLRLDLCSGVWLGVRTAEGRGYSESTRSSTTWLGVPVAVSLAQLSTPVGWEVGAGALFSFPRRDYTVAGVGTAYSSPPVGGVVFLRGLGVWPW